MEPGSITRLLHDLRQGAPRAEDRLFDRVYDELREIAATLLASDGQPGTAFVSSALP